MASFMLVHRHAAGECRFAYAAWRGFDSALRGHRTLSSCAQGGHTIWWVAEASDAAAALELLPPFVAARAEAIPVRDTPVP